MLITCPECGNKVSDSSYSCRKCGYKEYMITWQAGYTNTYAMSANQWSETVEEANRRHQERCRRIQKQASIYKSPKQEERERYAEKNATSEGSSGGFLIFIVFVLVVLYLLFKGG